jgi:hypothetical protein
MFVFTKTPFLKELVMITVFFLHDVVTNYMQELPILQNTNKTESSVQK